QSLDGPWPTAATRPHGGGYRLTSEVPSTAPAAAVTVVRRAAEVIPRQQTALEEAATALVLTDAARTGAIASYANGTSGLALAVEVVGEQAAQSEAFLDTLARYNTEIGQYVLAIMPSDTNAGSLAAAMVVTHERR
ncbi:MAG TPA: hypothetical protein VG713_04195, partial [Pirellulales bacterium]|nr:hypothetical protein [Pirellulales bacterium]